MDLRTARVRAARVFVLIGVALVALGVPTAAQADTRSCPPNFSGFPGASKIRVINAYCATAMRIVRNIRRNITRGLPERIGRFRCAYRYVTVGDATWQRARCQYRRKLITMRLTS